jgi:hypothetical protein
VTKRKPFRKKSKSKTSPGQPNLRKSLSKDVHRLQILGTLTNRMQDLDSVRSTSLQLVFSLTILFNMIHLYRILLIDFSMKRTIKLTKSSMRNNLALNKYSLLVQPFTKSSLQFCTSLFYKDVFIISSKP